MRPKDWLQSFLRGRGTPVLSFLDECRAEYLSAANLWNLARDQAKLFLRSSQQVFANDMSDKASMIEFFALMASEKTCFFGSRDSLPAAAQFFKRWQEAAPSSDEAGVILKTSGTSGQNGLGRFVFLSWSQVIEQVDLHAEHFNHLRGTQRLSLLPKVHGFGLILDFLVGLRLEQTVYLYFDPTLGARRLVEQVVDKEIDLIALTPRLAWILLLQSKARNDLNRELHLHVGGAVVEDSLVEEINTRGWVLHEGYGLTECGPGVMMARQALPKIEVELRDETNGVGKVWVKTPSLGWFEDRVLDERGYFFTGDLAHKSGMELQILGRSGEEIKTLSGTWTTKAAIESSLCQEFGLKMARLRRFENGAFTLWGFVQKVDPAVEKRCQDWFQKRFGCDLLVELEKSVERLQSCLIEHRGKDFQGPKRGSYDVAG